MTSRIEAHVSQRDGVMALQASLVAWLPGDDPAGLVLRQAAFIMAATAVPATALQIG
jgi:hypothetical protein